jgi:hypothetical protein
LEWGDERRRGLMAGWPRLCVPLGPLSSTGMVKMTNAMSGGGFDSRGRRISFLAGVVLIGIGPFSDRALEASLLVRGGGLP